MSIHLSIDWYEACCDGMTRPEIALTRNFKRVTCPECRRMIESGEAAIPFYGGYVVKNCREKIKDFKDNPPDEECDRRIMTWSPENVWSNYIEYEGLINYSRVLDRNHRLVFGEPRKDD